MTIVRGSMPALLGMFAFQVSAASFDCDNASTKVELIVCADTALSDLDEQLASIYRQALGLAQAGTSEPKASQRAWLKRRNACADASCVTAAYRERIAELEDVVGQELSGENIVGIYTRRDPDFAKESAPAEITIRALPDGRVAVAGEALWIGNADTGNVNIGTLEGEYVLRSGTVEYRDGDDEWSCVLTLRFTRDGLDVHEPKMTCGGMNVSFGGHYVRIPASH